MNKIVVLMSTYNGEKYIEEQLNSLITQRDVNIQILVRDDGSSDNTIKILDEWQDKGLLTWYSGENLGPALSFMDLVKKAPIADYYAFCDQDDYWDKDKLEVAVEAIKDYDEDSPVLYFSNKRLVDENLNFIENTKQNPKLTLESALIINPVTGCTLVINRKLLEIINLYDNKNLYMHDGWIYRVCMAVKGKVVFDKTPHISYRQHSNNVIGGRSNLIKKYNRRIRNVVINRNRIRERDAIGLLKGYSDMIDKDHLLQIKKIANYRKSIRNKMSLIFDKNFRTNKFEYNFSFICAVILNSF